MSDTGRRPSQTSQSRSDSEIHNLEGLLERLKNQTAVDSQISIRAMLDAIGRRSFGPILLFCGIIPASPLSGIPGLPTVAATLVFVVIVQLLAGRQQFWLPNWLLNREVPGDKFCKAVTFLQKPARWIDKLIHPRLQRLAQGPAVYVIAVICALIALAMPPLELVPFANTTTGIALSIFGLALISRDGLLVLIGVFAFAGSIALGMSALL